MPPITHRNIEGLLAVQLDHYILVFSGKWMVYGAKIQKLPVNDIWMYNLYTEQWRKQAIAGRENAPLETVGASATVIGSDIYTFGGSTWLIKMGQKENDILHKLTRTATGSFAWQKVKSRSKKKSPSPRTGHGAWAFAGKLWIFGGKAHRSINPSDYLNNYGYFSADSRDNQILCFDPSCNKWTNPQSFGDIPEPRSGHGTAIIKDKTWLYGGCGYNLTNVFVDLFELDMHSLTWTRIGNCEVAPCFYGSCMLNAVTENQVFVHYGTTDIDGHREINTWILDLSSMSWKKYSNPYEDGYNPYNEPTSTTGINNSAMIIVRKCFQDNDNLDDEQEPFNYFHMNLGAKSLQQLAMQTIDLWKHDRTLPWQETLPKKLKYLLGFPGEFY